MKVTIHLSAAMLLASITFTACNMGLFTGDVKVPAHQQFYFGGSQNRSVAAKAHNTGPVDVTLLTQQAGQEPQLLLVLKPGERGNVTINPKTALLLRNQTGQEANVLVKAPGPGSDLGMRYLSEEAYQAQPTLLPE